MKKIDHYMDLKNNNEDVLTNNFINSMKDAKFRNLISTLPAKETLLKKYTCKLEDASSEFDNCSNCKGLKYCKNKVKGYCYIPVVEENYINFEYRMCSYAKKMYDDEKYKENIEIYQASSSLKNACFKDMFTDDSKRLEIVRYFKKFYDSYKKEDSNKGLYLHGNFGSGKTYMVAALFNELAKKNIKSAIVYYPEFLRSLKESFNDDYKERFNYIRRVELLLLDDIGAEVVTSWSRDEILGSILQYRMENNLPTFFTSNLTIDELEEHLSSSSKGIERINARRITERIRYMCSDLELISANRRK